MTTYERPRFLDEDQAAEFLGVKPQTLNCWRCTKRYGLPYVKIGRLVRYKLSDLQKWLEKNTCGELVNA